DILAGRTKSVQIDIAILDILILTFTDVFFVIIAHLFSYILYHKNIEISMLSWYGYHKDAFVLY
ncbi:hypothetical protein, partial [Peptostreptococcus sp.]|uniref:hypothetical protein n=1 Tax=Peptostreptococcus sp. TaxID=1262 RepID=UPI0025FDC390